MDRAEQRRIVEALVLASPEPIPAARIASVVPDAGAALVRELIQELNADYTQQGRAFEIWEVAGGYQMRTRAEHAPLVQQIQAARPLKLSQAALETVAIVAYRQPVTRAEIEHVRGVDAGAVLRSLLERKLIRIAGHREVPGRPLLYATSRRFLEVFGLAKLEDLPTLRDLDELTPAEAGAAEPVSAEVGVEEPDPGETGAARAVVERPESEATPQRPAPCG